LVEAVQASWFFALFDLIQQRERLLNDIDV